MLNIFWILLYFLFSITIIGFHKFSIIIPILYSLIFIGIILFFLDKKKKECFTSFLLFCKKNIVSLVCLFFLNIIWANWLIFMERPGIEVGIALLIFGFPIWLISAFILQPLFFNKLVKDSKWRIYYVLYMFFTPIIFKIFGNDLGPTNQIQRVGSVLMCIIVPMCFLLLANQTSSPKKKISPKKKLS